MKSMPKLDAQVQDLLCKRIDDLIDYQNVAYATRYANTVLWAINSEQKGTGRLDLSRDVIRNLHKLMAYKDEYEVARLLIQNYVCRASSCRVRSFGEALLQSPAALPAVLRLEGQNFPGRVVHASASGSLSGARSARHCRRSVWICAGSAIGARACRLV